jgi:uncharacterized protein YkwD
MVVKERASVCSEPIAMNSELNEYARNWSAVQAADGVMKHSDLSFPGATKAENVAQGKPSPAAVMDTWMNSPAHRDHILTCAFTDIGIGYNSNGDYWTMVLAD